MQAPFPIVARRLLLALLVTSLAAPVPAAEPVTSGEATGIIRSSAAGFLVRHQATVAASPSETYRTLVEDIDEWWESDHTFSGDAANLRIEARPGGCLCETLPEDGGVTHLTVIHANPGKLLRLSGGLGPLQGEAVAGVMDWGLEPDGAGTRLTLTYKVSGEIDGGLAGWAEPVAGVLRAQFDGLVAHLESERLGTESP